MESVGRKVKVNGYILGAIGIFGTLQLVKYAVTIDDAAAAIFSILAIFNFIASCLWIYGVHKEKLGYLTVSLIWWLLTTIPCVLFVFFAIFVLITEGFPFKRSIIDIGDVLIYILLFVSLGKCFLFFLDVVCYRKLKEDITNCRLINPQQEENATDL